MFLIAEVENYMLEFTKQGVQFSYGLCIQLAQELSEDLDAHGVAYLWKVPEEAGLDKASTCERLVKELRRLDPRLQIALHGKEWTDCFISVVEGDAQKVPKDQVKVFRKEQTRGDRIMESLYACESAVRGSGRGLGTEARKETWRDRPSLLG